MLPEEVKRGIRPFRTPLYRRLMQDSDNFIAEQLLLACSGAHRQPEQPEAIRHASDSLFQSRPSPIRSSGGMSSLSRYNLFTPLDR